MCQARDLYYWVYPEQAAIENTYPYDRITRSTFRRYNNGISVFDGACLTIDGVSLEDLAKSTTASTFHVVASLPKAVLSRRDINLTLCSNPKKSEQNSVVWKAHALIRPQEAGCEVNGDLSNAHIKLMKRSLTLLAAESEIVYGGNLVQQLMMSSHQSWISLEDENVRSVLPTDS